MKALLGSRSFRRDPLTFVVRSHDRHGDFFTLPDRTLCVADPETALTILRDVDRNYGSESDFFATPAGRVRSRAAQVAIGREARQLLARHARSNLRRLTADAAALPSVTEWPRAGDRLLLHHLRGALAHDDRPGDLPVVVRTVAERGFLVRPRGAIPQAVHRRTRSRIVDRIADTATARRRSEPPSPDCADLLDVVLHNAPEASPRTASAIYLMLLRSSVAPISHTVSWALDLLARSTTPTPHRADFVVKESLRLWPVAWFLGRTARRSHHVARHRIGPGDTVAVCSYLVHRHPRHWSEPNSFRPERWETDLPGPFIPFGSGPLACAGTSVALSLATALLDGVATGHHLRARAGSRPHVEGIVAHPPFLVERRTH